MNNPIPADFLKAVASDRGVSEAELETLSLALAGKSTKAIASQLGISAIAVRKRLGEVYKKFQIPGNAPGKLGEFKQLVLALYKESDIAHSTNSSITPIAAEKSCFPSLGDTPPDLSVFYGSSKELVTRIIELFEGDAFALDVIAKIVQYFFSGNFAEFWQQCLSDIKNASKKVLSDFFSEMEESPEIEEFSSLDKQILDILAESLQPLSVIELEEKLSFTEEAAPESYPEGLTKYLNSLAEVSLIQQQTIGEEVKFSLTPEIRKKISNILLGRYLNKIGHRKYMDGEFQSAKDYLKWAIEFNPELAAAQYNLASTYEQLEDFPNARIHYQIAAEFNNRAADAAINNLARLEIFTGNSTAAIELILPSLKRVKDAGVKSSLHKNLGWAYWLEKRYKEAKEHLEKAIELDSDRALPYCLLAKVKESLGDEQAALASWENCLNKQAENTPWRLPELDTWRIEARQRLNTPSN
ncbi:MAG TPA: hypothetical protein DCY88_16405 [Cyanobacteria bacterium UBA11372]|nr:hypothetical protein [Cyanobacteria bacterium UBA11372]